MVMFFIPLVTSLISMSSDILDKHIVELG